MLDFGDFEFLMCDFGLEELKVQFRVECIKAQCSALRS